MHRYFNPVIVRKFINKMLPLVSILTVGFFMLGLYYSLIASPPDYQQGEAVRIMYVHVPAAWMSLGIYLLIAAMSASALIWRSPVSITIANCAAPIGTAFTLACLITGSIWGKPMWGTWWVWDARLTSMLILFFFYIGYMVLYNSYDNKEHAGKIASIFALVGVVNLPVIKFSVEWWNTLHQPASILRSGGVAIDSSMLRPLFLMFSGFFFFFLTVLFIRIKTSLLEKKILRNC
jgi:heme exporter protein C